MELIVKVLPKGMKSLLTSTKTYQRQRLTISLLLRFIIVYNLFSVLS